ncbi:unnamed protein product [Pleuronectes platessa]|uniref:Uncharacterized protein n=1 Tax=Pleuronectes platessa TaxID=8262 RepID=A0A9N7US84_PLEPL|nr:unnamed protein product [Pleuronectes platessa]
MPYHRHRKIDEAVSPPQKAGPVSPQPDYDTSWPVSPQPDDITVGPVHQQPNTHTSTTPAETPEFHCTTDNGNGSTTSSSADEKEYEEQFFSHPLPKQPLETECGTTAKNCKDVRCGQMKGMP